MNWLEYHSKSEVFANEAEAAFKKGDGEGAIKLYQLAADSESQALSILEQSKTRTLGITAVSAASLYFKGREFEKVEQLAYQWLASGKLPLFAEEKLQNILQTVWNENILQKADVQFTEGTVLISVSGGIVISGGAPLDLIHRKVDEIKTIFFRVIEMLLNLPFRKHGLPSSKIQEQFRPWLFQAPSGSYQFAVRVQKPHQIPMFGTPETEEITAKFIEILKATSLEPSSEELKKVIPNPEYCESFLKLARNLAPTGKTFTKLEVKSATHTETPVVVFVPELRKSLNKTLRSSKGQIVEEINLKEEQLIGILRALHLDKDWIEINIPERGYESIRIDKAGEVIDDIVGPMVNHRVIVDVFVDADGKYIFRDIQPEE